MTPQDHEARETIAMDEYLARAQWHDAEASADRDFAVLHGIHSITGRAHMARCGQHERDAALLRRAHERERVMREALFEIRSALDESLGDTDPLGFLPPDDVLRDEEPRLYCCIIASRALAALEADNG